MSVMDILRDLEGCAGGQVVYQQAKEWARIRNFYRRTRSLRPETICRLQGLFPRLNLSRVRYKINASLPPNWFTSSNDVDGMTFGYLIYFKGSGIQNTEAGLRLLIHELVHVDQVRQRGGSELRFACDYGRGYLSAGDYRQNPLEVEAYDFYPSRRPLPPPCSSGWGWWDLGRPSIGGGQFAGSLAAVSRRQGPWVLDVLGIGQDGHVLQYALSGAGWQWFDLGPVPSGLTGGGLTGPLTAVSRRQGQWVLDVFGLGLNGHVIQYALDSTGWKWYDLGAVPSSVGGGGLAGPLTAVSRREGPWVIDIFAVGRNGHVIQFALDCTGWNWYDLGAVPSNVGGGGLSGPLTAVSRREGSWVIDVFGLGTNGNVVQYSLDATGWHWTDLGGIPANVGGGGLTGPLTAVSRRHGQWVLDVFGLGLNGHVVQYALDSSGWKWYDLGAVPSSVGGGGLQSSFAAVSRRAGPWVIDLLGVGNNDSIVQFALSEVPVAIP